MCRQEGSELANDEIIGGFEYSGGRYMSLEDEIDTIYFEQLQEPFAK
jgi:non-homologous end joining protein Ku